jgi:hypothetical protein
MAAPRTDPPDVTNPTPTTLGPKVTITPTDAKVVQAPPPKPKGR